MIFVAIGGFFGAITRFWISERLNSRFFPYGTLAVNVLGSFLLGLLFGSSASADERLLFGTGFLGAFTTFSTWLFEVKKMKIKQAVFHVFFTCLFGFLGFWIVL